jgi:hypothetical protein
MAIVQLVQLIHQSARAGLIAQPRTIARLSPSWNELKDAITSMNGDRFMVVVSSRLDIDAVSDPDALIIEFGAGHGFMLYQQSFHSEIASSAWRSRSAMNMLQPSTISVDTVLKVAAVYAKGSNFDDISLEFPEV